MGVFQLPVKLCEELQSICAWFWWGQIGNKRKIHWLSWDKLTRPKSERRMGFKDLRQFNFAMLAKQGWRLMQDQESLMFQCFKARYFPRCHLLEATDSPNSSHIEEHHDSKADITKGVLLESRKWCCFSDS